MKQQKLPAELKIKKRLVLMGVFLIVLCVSILSIAIYTNNKTANCTELLPEAQNILKEEPGKTLSIETIKKRYQQVKPVAKTCNNDTVLSAASSEDRNANLLFFYREMAIASYSLGDRNDAVSYADKALALNDKVEDTKREGKAKKDQVRAEMEAIKNGVY